MTKEQRKELKDAPWPLRFIVRVAAGVPLSLLVLLIATGNPVDAVQVLALSIICTAGIGLVFWLPVWWITGWFTLNVIGLMMGRGGGSSNTSQPLHANKDEMALMQFMRRADLHGMGSEEVARRLISKGWDRALVERVHEAYSRQWSAN